MNSDLVLPDKRIVDSLGQPIAPGPDIRGLDLIAEIGGQDSISAVRTIQEMRDRGDVRGTISVAPDAVTEALLVEVALFNAEVLAPEPLTAGARERITAAIRKRLRKSAKRLHEAESRKGQ